MFETLLHVGLSLAVVLALMWGLAKLVRRPLTGGRGGGALAVLTRQQLSRGASVAVVRVADRAMVLGVTDNQVTLIGEADLALVEEQLAGPKPRRDPVLIDQAVPTGESEHDAGPASPVVPAEGRLAGSLLSPRTWTSTLDFLRERTVRR